MAPEAKLILNPGFTGVVQNSENEASKTVLLAEEGQDLSGDKIITIQSESNDKDWSLLSPVINDHKPSGNLTVNISHRVHNEDQGYNPVETFPGPIILKPGDSVSFAGGKIVHGDERLREGWKSAQELLYLWGAEEERINSDQVKKTFWRRINLASVITEREAVQHIDGTTLTQLRSKFPKVEPGQNLKKYHELLNPPKWRTHVSELKPKSWSENDSLIWVLPSKSGSTNKMTMKRVQFGKAVLKLVNPEEITRKLTKAGLFNLRENMLVVSPIGDLTYPFICDHYGNQKTPIRGKIHHLSIRTISKRRHTNPARLYKNEKLISVRSWSEESLGLIDITEKEIELSKAMGHAVGAEKLANPFEGRLPGTGKRS